MSQSTDTNSLFVRFFWFAATATWVGLMIVPLTNTWALAPDLGHGWSAPILIGYLWWDRSLDHATPSPAPHRLRIYHAVGIAILLTLAIPFRLLLTPYPLWPNVVWIYLCLIIAVGLICVWLRGGWAQVRFIGGPLVILIGVVPWPGVFERTVILPLREGIATIVAEASNVLGAPALAIGTSIQLANGWVGIDEACGGIRSLHACVTAALFLGAWWQLSLRHRLSLVGLAVSSAILGNFFRVSFLTWCVNQADGTIERWHDAAGWAALIFSLLATGLIGLRWRTPAQNAAPISVQSEPAPTAPVFSRPLVATSLLGLSFLLLLEGSTRWWFRDQAEINRAGTIKWTATLPHSNPTFQRAQLGDYAYEMLKPDHFESGTWRSADRALFTANYLEWETGQVARSAVFTHNPAICLPYSGFAMVDDLGEFTVPWHGVSIPFHHFVFKRMKDELVVAFTIWDPELHSPILKNDRAEGLLPWLQRQWLAVAEARKHQPAQLFALGVLGRENAHLLPAALSKIITVEPPPPPE